MTDYTRFVPYGVGRKGLRSKPFERRSKPSYRKWRRRKDKNEAFADKNER